MKKKIYIVDYLGIHCGMHYYNSSFKNYIEEINGLDVEILSNYKEKGTPFFYNVFINNKLKSFLFLILNYFRLIFKIISSKNNIFIFLSYGNIIDVIIMTITLFTKRVIIDVHEVFALQLKNKYIHYLLSVLYRNSVNTVIFHSERSDELLNKIGYKNKRIYVPHFKYEFVKTFDFKEIGDDIIQTISKTEINILFFGNVSSVKGIDLLLSAINLLPENIINRINIIIAGKDSDGKVNTVQCKNELSIKKVLRHISDDELVFLFTQIDYVILPYRKTSQSGILEMAFYFNKPIIATRLKYFERILAKFPSFGILMQADEVSISNSLIYVVNSHEKDYNTYFSNEDLLLYSQKNDTDKFIKEFGEVINNVSLIKKHL